TVVVFGAGPVGLFAMKSAWLLGAGRVIAVDCLDYRLDFARHYAQVETLNFKEEEDIILKLGAARAPAGAGLPGAQADGAGRRDASIRHGGAAEGRERAAEAGGVRNSGARGEARGAAAAGGPGGRGGVEAAPPTAAGAGHGAGPGGRRLAGGTPARVRWA